MKVLSPSRSAWWASRRSVSCRVTASCCGSEHLLHPVRSRGTAAGGVAHGLRGDLAGVPRAARGLADLVHRLVALVPGGRRRGDLHRAVEAVPRAPCPAGQERGGLACRPWPVRQVLGERRDELGEPRRRQPGVETVLRGDACGGAVLVDPLLDRADDEGRVLVREPAPQRVMLHVGVAGGPEHVPEVRQLGAQRIGDLTVEDRPVHGQRRAQPPRGDTGVVDRVVVARPRAGDRREQPLDLGRDVRLHDLARGSHPSSLARRPIARAPRRTAERGRSAAVHLPEGPGSARSPLVCCRSSATRR